MTLSIIFAIAILIVLREGYQQADSKEHSEKLSAIWHGLGFVMRLLVFVLLYLLDAYLYLLIVAALLMSVVYNIACSIGRGKKWYYVSNRGIDKLIRKVFFFVNFDK